MTIKTLFLDIGGVLLTNGWDRGLREKTLNEFYVDKDEFDPLHKQYYNLHEQGKISFDEYLKKTVFWKKRDFTISEFEIFIKNQTKPYSDMIELIDSIKKAHNLKVVAVSNEGRDLAEYRIKEYDLNKIFDSYIISSFVYFQKPDPHIYRLALDVTQSKVHEVLYIDDRSYLIEAASKLGIKGIVHSSFEATKKELEQFNLS